MFCPKCGQGMREYEIFCGNCGTQIKNASFVGRENIPKKSRDIKIVLLIITSVAFALFAVLFMFILEKTLNEDSEIEIVKNGVLNKYDYGICIGDALDQWFGGTEEWDSYVDGGITFVTAMGTTRYSLLNETEKQYFLFRIIDDEHFSFIGAYDMNGSEINSTGNDWYTNSFMDVLDLFASFAGTSFNELSLKAAFGDQASLEAFQNIKQNQL